MVVGKSYKNLYFFVKQFKQLSNKMGIHRRGDISLRLSQDQGGRQWL